ncbi:hypothetical protein ACFL4L_02335 [bacterium]
MRKRFYITGIFCILVLSLLAPAQVVIRDSVEVIQNWMPIPHEDDIQWPAAIHIDPVTGVTDTIKPMKITRELVPGLGTLNKNSAGSRNLRELYLDQYVVYHLYYSMEGCGDVVQYDYSLPVALIHHHPDSDVEATLVYSNFDDPRDGLFYGIAGAGWIYFYEIKMLPMECDVHYMCQHPDDEDVEVYMHVCETCDTSVPDTTVTKIPHELSEQDEILYTITWPFSQLTVLVKPPYYYKFHELPDTLYHNVSCPIRIKAYDLDGNEYFNVDPQQPIWIWNSEEGDELGRLTEFIFAKSNANGSDKLKSAKFLTTYEKLYTGRINFVADSLNPEEPTMVTFEVEEATGEYTHNKDSLVLAPLEATLSLTIPNPKEAWPTLRGLDGGNPNSRNIKGSIEVSLQEDDEPLQNHDVMLRVEMILPSGGHDHTNQPQLALRGHLAAVGAANVEGDGQVTAQTDNQGIITVIYTAPQFGGQYELIASAQVDGEYLEDRDTLTVRVPNLVELGAGNDYHLIGATNDHPDNHFAEQTVVTAMQDIATDWQAQFPNEHLVYINDMSLE